MQNMNDKHEKLALLYSVNMSEAFLPKAVLDLAQDSDRLVLDPKYLFFRESKPTFSVPDLQPWDKYGSMRLDHRLYYLWQKKGSLAVYAHYEFHVRRHSEFQGILRLPIRWIYRKRRLGVWGEK